MTQLLVGNAPCSWGTLEFEETKGEQIRFDPDAHRVIAGAEKANLTHSRNTIECIVDVYVRVVRQEK